MIKSIKYVAFALGLMSVASCSDFLDHPIDERIDLTIQSEDDEYLVIKLLNTAYPEGNYAWISELSSDNLLDNQCPHLPSSPNDKQVTSFSPWNAMDKYDDELYNFEAASTANYSDWDSPGMVWGDLFTSVATCNYVLEAIDDWAVRNHGVISEKLQAARAEAKLIRAYDHFILGNLFCQPYKNDEASRQDIGLPYVTKPETQLVVNYERGNVTDLYKHIQKDLEEGLAEISDINYGEAVKFHFNTNAAHAFAARFYLFTRQYDKVIEHADFVLSTAEDRTRMMLPDFSKFSECATLGDYSNVWQHPTNNNNLMLCSTASILERKVFGYRYSVAGERCREVLMVRTNSPLWSGYICPVQNIVGGLLFGSSSSDYGFFSSKIGEEFQYTDKQAGIGYPRIIQRTFTSSLLLLERAEAKIMTGDIAGGAADMMLYWNSSYDSFSDKDKLAYGKYFKAMTDEAIRNYYSKESTPNCFMDWSFTNQLSSEFTIPSEAIPYMNCLNDLRRYETSFEGQRFFDLKRWNMPYYHSIPNIDARGNVTAQTLEMPSNDSRRALEVPWESIASGFSASRPTAAPTATRQMTMDINGLVYRPENSNK